jgi:cyclopropane-fatty-acyl-phospholipid synthase
MFNPIMKLATQLLDHGMMPDALTRRGIRRLCTQRLRDEASRIDSEANSFIEKMKQGPIAHVPEKANEQHYEVPADFYSYCLGIHRKYSCCFWQNDATDLDQAEANALEITCNHACLRDGQDVLELGCGWGSLTLWMAACYPNSQITAVSNSRSQRQFIEQQARERGLRNIKIITCDMNVFEPDHNFDRIVSVEMFEHMRNYQKLLSKTGSWLRENGKLFVHIFCHRRFAYPFGTEGASNWMGRHFFTGGLMPSENVFEHFKDQVNVVSQWRWSGTHYERTANTWLANLDQNKEPIMPILAKTYGRENAKTWFNRWRIFFMACAELWGFKNGNEWFVSHYLLEPAVTSKERCSVGQSRDLMPSEPLRSKELAYR